MINVKELNKIVDKPYEYGKLDCLQLLKIAYGDRLPTEYKGISVEDYVNRFEDPQEACNFLVEAVKYYCDQVNYPRFGDICIIERINVVGLYVGNNHLMTAFLDRGVKVIPINFPVTYWRLKNG